MKNYTKRFAAIIGVGLALMMQINRAFGDDNSEFFAKLTAQWWQWALSIPVPVNPQTDTTGENAVVGQRGSVATTERRNASPGIPFKNAHDAFLWVSAIMTFGNPAAIAGALNSEATP